jgi:bud site selection protein 20
VQLHNVPKSLDEVYDEIHTPKFESVRVRTRIKPLDEELPGLGQHYCMSCARHFVNPGALEEHNKTKAHKRRVKELKNKPYGVDLEEVLCKKIDNGPKLYRNEQVRAEQEAAFAAAQLEQQQQQQPSQ